MSIKDIVAQAQELAKTDAAQAITMLENAKSQSGFIAHGAFALCDILKSEGRIKEEHTQIKEVLENQPASIRALQLLIDHRESDFKARTQYASRLLDVLSQNPTIPGSMHNFLPKALILADKEDISGFLPMLSGTTGEIESENIAAGVLIIRDFVLRLQTFLANYEGDQLNSWRLAVDGTVSSVAIINGKRLDINLAACGIHNFSRWMSRLSRIMLESILWLVPGLKYNDDFTINAWNTAGTGDVHACEILLPLRAMLLKDGRIPVVKKPIPVVNSIVDGQMYVRVGNVELYALGSYLTESSRFIDASATKAFKLLKNTPLEDVGKLWAEPYWPRRDPVKNIIRLSTNAGFYSTPTRASTAFRSWASQYIEAMERGMLLHHAPDLITKLVALRPGLRGKSTSILDLKELHKLLCGSRTVMVTAYADEISQHVESGGLFELWKDMGQTPDKPMVRAIQAPMSVWPYAPHESWEDTFNILCDEVEAAIADIDANLLMASCGCYGLPLVNAMNRRHGITSVYNGHMMNIYFGILTKATANTSQYKNHKDSKHWISSNLAERMPAINRIDHGRYA